MDEILSFAQRTALSGPIKPPTQLFCAREISLPSGISTANAFASLGSAAEVQSTSTSSTYADVINYTGKGVLMFCAFGADGAATQAEVTITIDGAATPQVNAVATTGAGMRVPAGSVSGFDGTNFRSNVSLEQIPFNVSLRIQLKRSSGAATVWCAAKYRPV